MKMVVLLILCLSGYLIMLAKKDQTDAQNAASPDDCPEDIRLPLDSVPPILLQPGAGDLAGTNALALNGTLNAASSTTSSSTTTTSTSTTSTEGGTAQLAGANATVANATTDVVVALTTPAPQGVPLTKSTALAYLSRHFPTGTVPKNQFDDCICAALGFTTISSHETLKTACEDFYDQQIWLLVMTGLAALAVVGLNAVLKVFLVRLAKFERPRTVSILTVSTAEKVFSAQFLNTAVVVYVLNSRFFEGIFGGEHADFSHKWYATVGLAISMTMLVNVLNPHVSQMCAARVLSWLNSCICGGCVAKTEEKLDKAYDPPEFELAPRVGALLNTLFCCLTFAAGCPILIWFVCLSNGLCYLCDRYALLRVCARPPQYDRSVMVRIALLLPLAMFLHVIVAVLMYGNRDVFPSHPLFREDSPSTEDEDPDSQTVWTPWVTFFHRGFTAAGFPYFLLFFFLLFYFALEFLKMIFGPPVELFLAACAEAVRRFHDYCLLPLLQLRDRGNEMLASIGGRGNNVGAKKKGGDDNAEKSAAAALGSDGYPKAQKRWREEGDIATYDVVDNPTYAALAASDIDLAYFAEKGVVVRERRG